MAQQINNTGHCIFWGNDENTHSRLIEAPNPKMMSTFFFHISHRFFSTKMSHFCKDFDIFLPHNFSRVFTVLRFENKYLNS